MIIVIEHFTRSNSVVKLCKVFIIFAFHCILFYFILFFLLGTEHFHKMFLWLNVTGRSCEKDRGI